MLTGDYQAVSTCFYRELRGYRKSDDPSMNTSTIVGSGVSGSPEKIEFIGTGEGITKVQAQLGAGAEIAWRGHMSILKQCAETLAAGTTASG
jgi:hypothetical protein